MRTNKGFVPNPSWCKSFKEKILEDSNRKAFVVKDNKRCCVFANKPTFVEKERFEPTQEHIELFDLTFKEFQRFVCKEV